MVAHSGTSSRPDPLRPLNRPQPIDVLVNQHRPAVLIEPPHRHRIEQIQETWVIDDEWWRDPIRCQYFRILLENGSTRTIFHDRTTGTWFSQSY